jgi:hypothetical protein
LAVQLPRSGLISTALQGCVHVHFPFNHRYQCKINAIPLTQDVDIVVTPDGYQSLDPEEIKKSIVSADDRYFLKASGRPGAKYRVLYCRLPGWTTERRRVKVDILVPPTPNLGIPRVLSQDAVIINGIPVMPIFDLLVLKMQGRRDHNDSRRPDFRAKVPGDISDVRALLNQAKVEEVSYRTERYIHTRKFMKRARKLALGFIEICGERANFRALGFPV